MKAQRETVHVTVENIKKTVPACRRCRLRSNEMLEDPYLPMLCRKCVGVIRDYPEYAHFIPLDKPPFDVARLCLWEHERECGCWADGCRFPEQNS